MGISSLRTTTARALRLAAVVFLLTTMFVPTIAGALEVDTMTARPNGLSEPGVVGGKPTRVTWEANTAASESVDEVTFEFPEGTTFSELKVNVAILEGLERIKVAGEATVEGSAVRVVFSPAVPVSSRVRVLLEGVVLPKDGGTFEVLGSYVVGGQESAIKSAPEITVNPTSGFETVIASLDKAAWVDKWTEVPILNMFLKPQLIVAGIKSQFQGWVRALGLVALGFPLAIPLGLMLALIKMSKIAPLKWIAALYVNVIRGTPLFLQIYIAFFGLPLVGVRIPEYLLGVLVLAFNSSAYLTEIFRAGIQSIHKGQLEAASSLGMSNAKAMTYVIIPQTIRRVLPTMTSEFILLYKDTSLLAAVGVMELMMYSKNLVATTGNVTPYMVAAGYYMLVTLPLIKLVEKFELRLARSEGGNVSEDTKPKRGLFRWKPDADINEIPTASQHASR